jgi:aromatic-L-amino-acid decarboxylase
VPVSGWADDRFGEKIMSDPAPSSPAALGDMSVEDFRRYGHALIEWIADYLTNIERYPVLSALRPGEIRSRLPRRPPSHPESLATILADFETVLLPGITHWNHPGFMAYFAITGSGPGILGELLSAALNVNAMLWKTSPAATELEEVVLDWLRQMVGLPESFEGVIYDTASISTLCALAAAREAIEDLHIRQRGLGGRSEVPRLRLYTSELAHSSVEKDAIVLGIGQEGVRKIATDEQFRLSVAELERAIADDRAAGWRPFCVVATVGTTSVTSIDPVGEIARVCARHGLWLHVDAAYAGSAAIVPELRSLLDGCDRADSIVINPHKWLFTPIDLSAFYSRRLDIVKRAFSLVPDYLRTSEDDAVHNFMDYGPQLGRRFRALKLWMVLRSFGHQGLADRIRSHIRLAQEFSRWVDAHPDFERLAPVPLSTVCFRARPRRFADTALDEKTNAYLDQLNSALLDAVNASGECFLSHTRLRGRFVLRLAIGNIRTTEKHVARAWEILREHAARLDAEMR